MLLCATQNNIPTLLYSPWEKMSNSKSFKSQKFSIWGTNRCVNIVDLYSILLYKTKSRNFKSHGLKAVGCLEEQIRAQWTDFFMVCNMATKNSGFPEKPVEKIRFEIFKKLSCLHFLAKFNEFWILCSSRKDVQKLSLALFRTGSSGSGNSVFVFMYYCALFRAPL